MCIKNPSNLNIAAAPCHGDRPRDASEDVFRFNNLSCPGLDAPREGRARIVGRDWKNSDPGSNDAKKGVSFLLVAVAETGKLHSERTSPTVCVEQEEPYICTRQPNPSPTPR